ncbi:MAG TPA: hypothetical protein VER76_16155, partial [Pyrinomonadaceae bacterium]|nr:hypothetical protein [Pyrinomonadaceae bacterium]
LAQGNRIWEHKQMADQLLAETINGHTPAPLLDTETRRQLLPPTSLRIEPKSEVSGQKLVKTTSDSPSHSSGR